MDLWRNILDQQLIRTKWYKWYILCTDSLILRYLCVSGKKPKKCCCDKNMRIWKNKNLKHEELLKGENYWKILELRVYEIVRNAKTSFTFIHKTKSTKIKTFIFFYKHLVQSRRFYVEHRYNSWLETVSALSSTSSCDMIPQRLTAFNIATPPIDSVRIEKKICENR